MPKASNQINQSEEQLLTDAHTHFRAIRSEIAKQAVKERVAARECPGVAPTGYRNVIVGWRRTVGVNKRVAPLVVEAFHLAAQRKGSLRRILAVLTPRGLVGRGGKTMGVSGLHAVLTNPLYAGFIRHRGQLLPGTHQPLISKTLFDKVQSRLFRRRCR